MVEIRFRYDEHIKAVIKRIPGASWEAEQRIWTVESHHASELLAVVEDFDFVIEPAVREIAARGGNNARMRQLRRASRGDAFTPGTLNAHISALVRKDIPSRFWIIGQISNWKGNGGRGFFELVEQYADEAFPRARLNAHISIPDFQRIDRLLQGLRPPLTWTNRLRVRVKASLVFRERWGGMQLRVIDIDPHYTITLLNAAREEALRVLDDEGISEKNLSLPFPAVPLRVVLLTSADSDAAHDVIEELRQSGLGFSVDVVDVRVSGSRQEKSMLHALQWVGQNAAQYDVVIIARGGGSRNDLAGFDLLSLGRAVCLLPLPVVCGIGHERDHSLLDDVARSCKTPTRAAATLVEQVRTYLADMQALQGQIGRLADGRVREFQQALSVVSMAMGRRGQERLHHHTLVVRALKQSICHGTENRVRHAQTTLAQHGERLTVSVSHREQRASRDVNHLEKQLSPRRLLRDLRREQAIVDGHMARLKQAASGTLHMSRQQLDVLNSRRDAVDPAHVLARGYAVVSDADGRVIRDAKAVAIGQSLRVQLHQGVMHVTRDVKPGGEHE